MDAFNVLNCTNGTKSRKACHLMKYFTWRRYGLWEVVLPCGQERKSERTEMRSSNT